MDERFVERVVVDDLVHRQRQPLADLEIRRRIAADLRPIADDEDAGHDAALLEMPRDRESVAAIRAEAAEDRGAVAVGIVLADRIDDRQRRVLHQHDRRNAEALGRAPVDRLHLRSGEDVHRESIQPQRRRRAQQTSVSSVSLW